MRTYCEDSSTFHQVSQNTVGKALTCSADAFQRYVCSYIRICSPLTNTSTAMIVAFWNLGRSDENFRGLRFALADMVSTLQRLAAGQARMTDIRKRSYQTQRFSVPAAPSHQKRRLYFTRVTPCLSSIRAKPESMTRTKVDWRMSQGT